MHYLVMWSGGIDSTYVLAKMLKETDHEIHAHHIHLVNKENRAKAESDAVNILLKKLNNIRSFDFSQSLINYPEYSNVPYDMASVCFEAGAIQKEHYYNPNKKPFDKWTIGTHEDEGHWQERWNIIHPCTKAACWPETEPEFVLQPMIKKHEEMKYLHDLNLLDNCWYCRYPSYSANGKPATCNQCKTCQEVTEHILKSIAA